MSNINPETVNKEALQDHIRESCNPFTAIRGLIRFKVGEATLKNPKAQISPAIQELMTANLTEFVILAVNKFVQGQIEHGGDIRDRNLDFELAQETVDMFWYNSAKKWPKHIR